MRSSSDSSVGGLVWVRRRNGSWWPGRILCPDEVPESCLVSPRRSGTPVQLLGREDASVDWYNLEKSKRIKAFRCGEYDECIEKAKVTGTTSCKQSVKYARREDAILHALELENSQLSKNNNPETTSQTNRDENLSDKLCDLDSISISPRKLSRTAASADNSLDSSRQCTPNDSEDDGTEGSMKRMRGLEDLGIGRAILPFKKKRTRVAHIHNLLKKKSRRRQLTKVLKKTAMVTVPVMCEEVTGLNGPGFSNNKVPHSTYNVMNSDNDANNCKEKDNENSSNSELLEIDDSSGRLFDVPFTREEKHTAGSSPGLVPEMGQVGSWPQSGQSNLVETVSVEPDEIQESGSISSGVDINHIMDNGTSKWQNKGKRNSRNKNKTRMVHKILDSDDELKKLNNMVDLTTPQRSLPIRQSCLTGNPRYQPLDLACKKTDTGSLYDVNIEVEARHFLQRLPYVSLMSELTGQPVTGHSVRVKVLNDTVSDLSFNSSDCLSSSCELGKVNNDIEMVPEASKKPRKNGLLSNKKIRRLSSLTSSKRPSETGTLKRPDLACIPLKVVFGRIYATLGISSADAVSTR
ncbi:hypothetical protein L1987_30874 [Smallanthus sonchifolius]|uniref:Uncharacterized protein n=1 Tax=Smallanthus sonchifolius TaxID=185202 RepID=A0ACB9I3C6_9ASTR|nr:hypothetical protein L1987_30874 [Smallanthus sonchifolius]